MARPKIVKTELGQRLIEPRKDIDRKELAKLTGVSDRTIGNYERGESNPDTQYLHKLSDVLSINLNWLVTGLGPMKLEGLVSAEKTSVKIPRYDVHLSAGDGHLNDHKATLLDYIPFTREFLQKKLNRSSIDDLSILEATGDSMLPTISDGDLVLIDESDKTEIDGIFAYVQGDFAHIKRLHFMMGGKIEIVSDNNLYSPQILSGNDLEHFRILGRVRWIGHTV